MLLKSLTTLLIVGLAAPTLAAPSGKRYFSKEVTSTAELMANVMNTLETGPLIHPSLTDTDFSDAHPGLAAQFNPDIEIDASWPNEGLPTEAQIIRFLNEKADLIIAQYPESIQPILHEAYYYDEGLIFDKPLKSDYGRYELSFGHPSISLTPSGFYMTWLEGLNRSPMIDKILKIDQVLLRLGLHLLSVSDSNDPLQRLSSHSRRRHFTEVLYMVHASLFYTRLLDDLMLDDTVKEILIALKGVLPREAYTDVSSYIYANEFAMEQMNHRVQASLADFNEEYDEETEVKSVFQYLKALIQVMNDREQAIRNSRPKDILLTRRVDQVYRSIKAEYEAQQNETKRDQFLTRQSQKAIKAQDQVTTDALNRIFPQDNDICAQFLTGRN